MCDRRVDPKTAEAIEGFACAGSFEDAVCEAEQPCLDTSVEAARVGARATPAQRVFITFGGP